MSRKEKEALIKVGTSIFKNTTSQIENTLSLFEILQDEGVHYDEMAGAPAHHKQMEDLMAPKVLMLPVEQGKLQA